MATELPQIVKKDRSRFGRWSRAVCNGLVIFWEYVKHHYQSALFVTACVSILHAGTSWLHALDTYGFVWVANIASDAGSADVKAGRIAVVEIDDATFDRDFSRRSPLKRDQLFPLLSKIYETKPAVLVIDLDLSPAAPGALLREPCEKVDGKVPNPGQPVPTAPGAFVRAPCERAYEDAIRDLILKNAGSGTTTVLLEPFSVQVPEHFRIRQEWRDRLEADGKGRVLFGNGDIPESFGMSNRFFRDGNSIYAAARGAATKDEDEDEFSFAPSGLARDKEMIDPRTYMNRLTVVTTSMGEHPNDLACVIRQSLDEQDDCSSPVKPKADRVIYFGAAYGGDDLFTTPLGRLYGVEVHAAAFATCWPAGTCWLNGAVKHVLENALDLAFGFLAGFWFAHIWNKYTAWRMSPDPEIRAVAGIAVFKLMCVLAIALFVLTVVAGLILGRWGVWFSPIPMAVGMFIEAWVTGPITPLTPAMIAAYTSTTTPAQEGKPAADVPKLLGIQVTATSLKLLKRLIFWPVLALGLLLIFI